VKAIFRVSLLDKLVYRPASALRVVGMGRIAKLPSIKPRLARRHPGLRKLSPDLISKARDETATQVTRVGLTFLGTVAFCLLSLLSPDSALLGGSEKINVPFAGPVSFFGFMLLGPAVLIVLRVYLQIYVEHSNRLDRLARSVSAVRAPTLVPLKNSLIRLFSGLIFYLLLPVTIMLFAWKAAAFPAWGSGLFSVAVAVIATHVMLPYSRLSWRSKGLLSVSTAIIAGGIILGFGLLRRPFDLDRANLSGHNLVGEDLRAAHLWYANLSGADLSGADVSGANLSNANLNSANLSRAIVVAADLSGAKLGSANLSRAIVVAADLSGANLGSANLSGADLAAADLSGAKLGSANLSRAIVVAADLSYANLVGANLSHADLSCDAKLIHCANLVGANLSGADLSVAYLSNAELSNANLSDANLSDANLSGANLSGAKNLTQTQLDKACGNGTKLPEGLILVPCSPHR
jgi:uncharacterized protein YjbI with pentapeptide repeats